jgi:hypothetical protein
MVAVALGKRWVRVSQHLVVRFRLVAQPGSLTIDFLFLDTDGRSPCFAFLVVAVQLPRALQLRQPPPGEPSHLFLLSTV